MNCICTTAPMGQYGLEGFVLNNVYEFSIVNGKYRVTLNEQESFNLTVNKFNLFFKVLKSTEVDLLA